MTGGVAGYRFLDCGHGRRLERMGGVVVDRPAPAATGEPALPPARWREAALCFHRGEGWRGAAPEHWRVSFGRVLLELRPAAAGGVGLFPEHLAVSDRLDGLLDAHSAPPGGWRILNLFAHTGLATLRLACRGDAAVTHVDAAAAAVRQARINAALSGLSDAPLRWLVDDALGFLGREIRREKRYHLILADPPAYGRGGKKHADWKLERDLPVLLQHAGRLLGPDALGLCLTCHSDGWHADRCADAVRTALPRLGVREPVQLGLGSPAGGAFLPSGWMVIASNRE